MKKLALIVINLITLFVFVGKISFAWATLEIEEKYLSSKNTPKRVMILINSNIFDDIYHTSEFINWKEDLEAEKNTVLIIKYISGTAGELRTYITDDFNNNGLNGIIIVGDIIEASFEEKRQPEYISTFPTDLFFTDLNGEWLDEIRYVFNGEEYVSVEEPNGVYDKTQGKLSPEIWLGRLKTSVLEHPEMNEVDLIKNYFLRNHKYRTGQFEINKRGLYYNDLWLLPDPRPEDYADLEIIYNDVDYYYDYLEEQGVTNGQDYLAKLGENYEWVWITAHSGATDHNFEINPIDYNDILSTDVFASFYWLSASASCGYSHTNYLCGHYVFSKPYGLVAFGSTRSSGLNDDSKREFFWPYLGANYRKTTGEAFYMLFNGLPLDNPFYNQYSDYYNWTLIGDPTLSLDPPIAHIDSIDPITASQGETVSFHGSSNIGEDEIANYSWRSNIDGVLNTGRDANSFSTNSLSLGEHIIYFQVADNLGRWSSENKKSISVLVTPNACQADLNYDGTVDTLDVKTLLCSWFSPGFNDLNSDFKINSFDFATLKSYQGQTCDVPPPEIPPTPPTGECIIAGETCDGSSLACCGDLICDSLSVCRVATENDKYFTVSRNEESFCLYVTDPETIKLAWDSYKKLNGNFPMGPLLEGDGGFNFGYGGLSCPNSWQWWNWHFDPEKVNMVYMAPEICDAPFSTAYQTHLMTGNYCPWGTKIIAIGCVKP